jgi:hypothetical protein
MAHPVVPQLPQFPSVFPIWWVAGTALAGSLTSLLVLWLYGRRSKEAGLTGRQTVIAALVTGASIFAWRLSGNVPELNDDPIGALSPNDWLCPVVTYVVLGIYGALWPPANRTHWARVRALLTIVSFGVNVVTI